MISVLDNSKKSFGYEAFYLNAKSKVQENGCKA
jgi:hypothetical protein